MMGAAACGFLWMLYKKRSDVFLRGEIVSVWSPVGCKGLALDICFFLLFGYRRRCGRTVGGGEGEWGFRLCPRGVCVCCAE